MFIIIGLVVLSALSKAVMDSISHGFSSSVFSNLNPNFWDPKVSWRNKYRFNNYFLRLLFSTIFVMFTDAWHLFQFFAYKSIILAVGLSTIIPAPEYVDQWYVWAILLAIIHQSFFHFFYSAFRRISFL